MTVPDRLAAERLRDFVTSRLGLVFEDAKLDFLAETLEQRRKALRLRDADSYLSRLDVGPAAGDELRTLATQLTVGETYFFRNPDDLRAFVEVVLPARVEARAPERQLRLLSAGCSSGEEPYTLAMLVRQHLPDAAAWKVDIRGVDVNSASLERARKGRYSQWSLRQTRPDARARFFRQDGREFRLEPAIASMVTFEERNLLHDDPLFWARRAYDVIFCRNVTMYFSQEVTRRIVARFASSLAPGGFLFLGHAETLRGVSSDFHLRHTHETFYYQLKDGSEPPSASAPSARRPAPSASPVAREDGGSWVAAIQRATTRIASLARGPAAPPGAPAAAAKTGPLAAGPSPLVQAFELVRAERFNDALGALAAVPAGAQSDPDVLLLRAVLLTNGGDREAAERDCARIFERDELNAEAHYVMALCREHAGDLEGAADHDQSAIYLDPGFAMPRLHLGLMAQRAGERDAARRELAKALALLPGEEASRVLLLGGGFGRDALIELCRSELRACGGVP
jgi:chemotaxis protein methyltransferase CheR